MRTTELAARQLSAHRSAGRCPYMQLQTGGSPRGAPGIISGSIKGGAGRLEIPQMSKRDSGSASGALRSGPLAG